MLSEKHGEVPSELLPDEGVDDGVDAAVRHAEGLRHLHGSVQLTAAPTVTHVKEFLEGAQEKNDVAVRGKQGITLENYSPMVPLIL